MPTLVILESPYAGKGNTPEQIEESRRTNIRYARKCMRDSLLRDEAPFISHLLYTQRHVLSDDSPEERSIGILAGLEWGKVAEKTVVYTDMGVSRGMAQGIEDAMRKGRPIEYRSILKPRPVK